jgi:methionine sulfoxide reductase heme-binding subunit
MPTRFRASTPGWTSGATSEPAAPAHPDAAARVRRVKPITLVRVAVFLAALVPVARLVWGFYTNDLTANPGDYITDQTGTWTLGMLFSSLSITPLRRFTGWNELIKLRRMLGLFAFFYAVLHMLTWVVFIHYFDVSFMVEDVVKRPFITVGMTVLVILLSLALTSNRFAIRKLGRRWQYLHRLAYVAAIGGVIHFWWLVKADITEPRRWAMGLAVLLGLRAWWAYRKRASSRASLQRAAART